ncbi:2-polyprenyl-6-methoxyphenol hydroxylase-like FAD-dependent oxidoreductase [Microbacterium endophyticum]|uniref:2-polyprenyl-6-methoxyphenol hydroxylase-like FAD-dependent oxidoreductase n=1 Tax=Microbacterium endophyticum TaxID=1526412 RepID=A0A7W4V3E5_9MICO|nr:FAD-dependent monooxygenase [Microbacterium endophyticum]MBB2976156.1 2-polyprenyl-6-methoxyphenol hydroxylase-like FAD-dependent oxidoreductase [Microbacterium endophyticum]NIK36453.1 2-polyprenyl-6-methoxyphenol hydroxylase-like FAD-dependent oxidoreductase [Microbacterium endophyticum]
MSAVNKVAVVGSGVAGLAASIQLAKAGVSVDLYEATAELYALGSGISLQGNALRVFDALGAWDDILAAGYAFEGLTLRAPGPDAPIVAELPDVKTGGPDYPAAMGMPRADLARILADHAVRAGVVMHFSSKVTGLEESEASVELFVNDASAGSYDLVIGADGVNSRVRELIGIDTKPEPTGMGIWRTFVSRPPEVERSELYYGGPVYIAGYTPTGEDSIYAFLVEKAQDRVGVTPEEATRIMLEESRAYGGPWNAIRADLENGARANYTWFTKHIVTAPWNRGRTVIIGDAAHSCPPTIAQGAAQGLEDAYVLTELLVNRDTIDQTLWDEFHERRIPRAQAVVEASVQLGQWQIDGDRDADAGGLIFGIAQKMAQPA